MIGVKIKKSKVNGVSYIKLHNTPLKMAVVSGLNFTNTAVFTRLSNLMLGVDGSAEVDRFTFNFNQETTQYELDFHFTVGVTVIDPSQVEILKLK